jgi:protein-disulfide isomerase
VRLVWQDDPLPFHEDAHLAAEAAAEALAQRGPGAFWRMHDALYAHQHDKDGLKQPALEEYARGLGLDVTRFRVALESHARAPAVDASVAAAARAKVGGTPTFYINGYPLSGAQRYHAFARLIDLALAE